MQIKTLSVILTPAAQAEAGCKGPTFENPIGAEADSVGLTVCTKTLDTDQVVEYFYPMHQIARVKTVFKD